MYEYVCMSTIVGGHKGAIFPPMSDQISLLQNHGPHRTESCPQDSRQPRHHEEERSLKTFSVLSFRKPKFQYFILKYICYFCYKVMLRHYAVFIETHKS
jgi:hypothetical protein